MSNPNIKAPCLTCGEVGISNEDVSLKICVTVTSRSYYTFHCPVCHTEQRHLVNMNIIARLRHVGVVPIYWKIPAEALEVRFGGAINEDDLIDFMNDLEKRSDWDLPVDPNADDGDGNGTGAHPGSEGRVYRALWERLDEQGLVDPDGGLQRVPGSE